MFRYVIIMTIISNCVVMSMDEHLPHGDKTVLAKKLVITPPLLPIAIIVIIVVIIAIGIIVNRVRSNEKSTKKVDPFQK